MECATRKIVAYEVLTERTQEALQEMVLRAPFARQYYSDGFEVYPTFLFALFLNLPRMCSISS